MNMVARTAVLFVVMLALAGCVLPEGSYTVPAGYSAEVYNEQGTQVYQFCSGYCPGEPTPTPDSLPFTPVPTLPPVKVCELVVQGSPHNVRSQPNPSASILGNLGIGSTATGLEFFYPLDLSEWARVAGINYLTGNPITGWILVNSNVLYDPQGPCLDVPATYEATPVPTYTPAPTFTPVITPTPIACTLIAPSTGAMNVRALPSLTASIVGSFGTGAETAGLATYTGSGYLWFRVWWFGQDAWIAKTGLLTTKGACDSLPAENPFEVTALGLRTVPGAVNFTSMYPILAAKGIPYGVSPYASIDYCTGALDAGGICIIRPGAPDCPSGVGTTEPRANARDFMKHAALYASILKGRENVWIEPINECMGTPIETRLLAWWAEWMDEYLEQATALGWPPLALPSLPPGHGDQLMFSMWKPVLQKLAARNGLFSMHAYTFNSLTDLCVCDPWEACRHVTNHDLMLSLGYDIPFTLTEAARHAGNAPVSVDDMVCFYNKVKQQGFVHSLWLWLGGYHPVWPNANLDNYCEEIAQRA